MTRKITRGLARIKAGLQQCVYLGNMDARRDWGHARDYVEMQWLMLQQDEPEDYVIASGAQHSVREFVELAGAKLDMEIEWHESGVDEYGCDENGNVVVRVDSRYFRPTEVETLLGDATKAREKLGWSPKISFDELVAEMVESDMRTAERDAMIQQEGYQAFNYNE